jgi:hypothetical protein
MAQHVPDLLLQWLPSQIHRIGTVFRDLSLEFFILNLQFIEALLLGPNLYLCLLELRG